VVLTKEQIPQRGDILNALHGLPPTVRVPGRRDDTRIVVRNAAVECVEVRRGFSAVADFKPSIVGEDYAGVVLIWTRGALGPRPRACMPGGGG
jgi:hypothetical protein